MVDAWSSSGLGIPRQIANWFTIPLPMSEDTFQSTDSTRLRTMHTVSGGLWAQMIRLADIFTHVQSFHQDILSSRSTRRTIEDRAIAISGMFERYRDDLPQAYHFNQINLDSHIQRKLGSVFVALHLGYHHYASLLYFHFLDKAHESDLARAYAERCKDHAAHLSDLNKTSMASIDTNACYHIVGHMATISSAVLLYTLLFGKEHELVEARRRLETNFLKLLELIAYWPELNRIVSSFYAVILNSKD